ncbi:putative colanic acid biosynthesis acetyltransferase [Noviherbaspirillum galbum]|uniref:Colanic acid biosynthesis acetyltransferase WcaF n=1 Tax=Noviherbaspirillum galbum TaxID=2709383 RepID=A0A6B3SWF8_9BURK|nr:putative colanic acid biosynthesis acetyltransferase [Noviherbaspirillum galbum]NEX62722.1 colanic acid biosynthesis acetyltransferase WcaF [Noviherbaspirillum galbum]
MMQDLSRFRLPPNFRGRSAVTVQLWWLVQATLFRASPQFMYGFRNWLLRRFGARIGKNVLVRPTATITYPWKVSIGDHAWIGDHAVLYSLGEIDIGQHAVVSQACYLCGGDHDYAQVDFPIRGRKITIGDEAWLAADVFVAPGITIGKGAVVGARSSVFRDMPAGMVCMGSPARPVKPRLAEEPHEDFVVRHQLRSRTHRHR